MTQQEDVLIGVIGGTGVYHIEGLTNIKHLDLDTPFGKPSCPLVVGEVDGIRVAFLSRHGLHHHFLPSDIPFRANIYAFKMIGVKYLLSFGACGSLKEEVKPLDIVLVDQFIDRTVGRVKESTFFSSGLIAHVAFGEPVCPKFRDLVLKVTPSVASEGVTVHNGGTYVCMEGPVFSTRAESNLYRQWGASLVGMTAIPEAKLAREAEIAYCLVGLVTDYDCWRPGEPDVTTSLVMEVLKKNGDFAQRLTKEVVKAVNSNQFDSTAHTALLTSILTHKEHISPAQSSSLSALIGKYLN
jgi:5'-methylthioadenosine phosphorylase